MNSGQFRKGDPKLKIKTASHRKAIGDGQRRAWATTRKRKPIGSTWVDAGGYVRVKVVDGKGPWMLQHVLAVEATTGRKIQKGEIIHHINGDRKDNRIENLYVCRDHSHHNEVHRSQDRALRVLLAAGRVVFLKGKYEAVL